jgi:hypothetical protein
MIFVMQKFLDDSMRAAKVEAENLLQQEKERVMKEGTAIFPCFVHVCMPSYSIILSNTPSPTSTTYRTIPL